VAPYFENFDVNFDEGTGADNAGSTIDPCWTRNPVTGYHWGGGQGGTPTGNTGPSADHTSGNGNYVYAEASFTNPGLTADLESPLVDLSALTTPELVFWYHMFGASLGDLQVDVFDGTAWVTNVDQIVGDQGNQWFERRVDLSAFAGQTIRLRFVAATGIVPTQLGDIAIDDLSIDEAPTCPVPSAFTSALIGDTSATFTWTSGGASNWQIEYGPAGFTPGTGTIVNASTNPFTLTGLSPLTSYSFYLRDSCGTGDVSDWVGPVDLTTLNCSVGCNYNLRLTDSFGDGWDAFTGNFHEVIITVGGTPTSYTLLAGNQEDFTITFCDGDQFDVDFVNAGQWSQECGILVTDPAGATVYQRLPGTALGTGNLFSSIADCSSAIACADPSGLGAQGITQSTADLVFNSPGGTSRIEYGPTGFTPGTGTLITLVTSSPFTATGLTSNTSYDFYVQDSCGLGVTSNWVGPFTFTTNNCPPVTANFTYTVTGTTINVDGTSSSASFFTWDFGGQGASFDSVATYTFGTEGSYDVTLINSNGCGSTDTMTVTLDFCTPLTASFTEITNFLDVDLNAVGSLGLPTQYDWDFGDGNSTTTTGVLTNHTYATDGLYTVTLVLTNACGETDTVTSDIQVCDIISGNIAYSFTGTTFSFDGSGSSTNAVDFQWYFGDGGQDTVSNPSYTYTSSGTYNVSLVVTNACGESDSVTIPVTVCAKPNASWTFSVIQTSPFGMEVQFDASSSTGAISYSWDFGDGGTNNTSGFPIHTYNTPGFFYVVTLIVYNSCGDSDTLRSSLASIGLDNPQLGDELNIYPNPTSDFVQINWSGLPTDDPVHIELVDVQGRSVQSFDRELNQGNLELRLDLTGLAKGPYFIRMRQGRRELLRKLILD
jgi:PKD repeat protein